MKELDLIMEEIRNKTDFIIRELENMSDNDFDRLMKAMEED